MTLPEDDDPPPPPPIPAGQYWLPPPVSPDQPPGPGFAPDRPAVSSSRSNTRGLLGGLAAAAAALGKYGFLLLKFGKIGPTLISMVVSVFILGLQFGWAFGVGLLLLIAIHESGHMLFAAYEGFPVTWPIFLGPFGAFVSNKRPFDNARQEAVVAIGGPVLGTAAALGCYLLASSMAATRLHFLLIGLAYFGCFINLFNLIPFSPLDGGRVVGALSKWFNVIGLVLLALVLVASVASGANLNPLLFLIIIAGVVSLMQRFKLARRGLEAPPLPARTRVWIGVAYFAILAVSGLGMTITHAALMQNNYAPGTDA